MRALLVSLLLISASTACNKHKGKCEAYADWSMKCDKDGELSGGEKDQVKTMVTGMCLAAFEGEYAGATGDSRRMMEEMYENLKKGASCAESVKSCDEFKKCEDLVKK